jgi:hypothetical protein
MSQSSRYTSTSPNPQAFLSTLQIISKTLRFKCTSKSFKGGGSKTKYDLQRPNPQGLANHSFFGLFCPGRCVLGCHLPDTCRSRFIS